MVRKEQLKSFFSDIRTWIIFFFLIRLIGITNAPLEIGHNWRQSLTSMIARNFLEGGANLLYPRVDMAGNSSGIIGSEFPFFNYLIYLTSLILDYRHWHGRLINLVVSSFGVYFYYLLLEKLLTKKIAFNSSIILLASIWFAFSRKTMPDTFSVSLVIIGLYYCFEYLNNGKKFQLFLFFLFSTLGILCKIPALSLVSLVLIPLFAKEISSNRKVFIVSATVLSFALVSLWYFYWVPFLVKNYHYQLYFPKGLGEGFREISSLWGVFFEKFYYDSLSSFVAFAFFLFGLFFLIKEKFPYVLWSFLAISLTFFLFILKTGAVFPTHSYYIIPYTPVMAFVAGLAIAKIPRKLQYIVLVIIALEGIANQQHDFFIKKTEKYKISLEKISQKTIPKDKLIVINGGPSPQEIYFSNRKGWTIENKYLNKIKLDSLKALGASYLIIDKNSYAESLSFYPVIFRDENFDIYDLK
jgi:hypothetical protein